MSGAPATRNPVEELAEEFLDRYRRGERPALTEYTRRHPELAEEIRDLFPALVMMEEAGPKSATPAAAHATASAGAYRERLGDYRILREVGRGGMGIVYEAEQEALNRHVALKVLPAQSSANPIYLQRFRREARSAARLHHTNIVPVFDVGEFQGTHYYAMQFIQGQGLDEVLDELRRLRGVGKPERSRASGDRSADPNLTVDLAQGLLTARCPDGEPLATNPVKPPAGSESCPTASPPLVGQDSNPAKPPEGLESCPTANVLGTRSELSSQSDYHFYRSTARVGLQVAEALAYAHAQKVLHRDIKPANLLLDLQGTTWVTDFGLAKEEGDDLTQTGDLVGTLRYMAPERFNGVSDARSDVYSLGLTLYELLTLRPAFDETDRGRLIKRIAHEDPPRPRKLDPRLPRDLETIILKASAKEPRLRYQNADEMCEDLQRFLADRPIRARRSAAWEHAWRWCRRNPQVAGLGAVVCLLLLVVAIGVPVAVLLRGERDRALTAEADARIAEAEAHAAEKRAQKAEGEVAFRSHLAQAAAYRHAGQVGQTFKSMAEVKQALALARKLDLGPKALLEVRNEAIACLCLPDLEVVKEWDGWPSSGTAFTLDPTFRRYAIGDKHGKVVVRRVRDDQVLCQIAIEGAVDPSCMQFSPDGRLLHVMGENRRGHLFRLDEPQAVSVLADDHHHLTFRPDGCQYAAGYADGTIRVFEAASGKDLREFPAALPAGCRLVWNPKIPRLLAHSPKGIWLVDLEYGEVRQLHLPTPPQWADWHADGRMVAVSGDDRKVYLWDTLVDRLVQPPFKRMGNLGNVIRFNHAGDRLLSTEWFGQWRFWDSRTGQQILTMPGGSGSDLQFRADDAMVAVGMTPPKLRLYHFRAGREVRTLPPPAALGGDLAYGYLAGWGGHASLDETGRLYAARVDGVSIALIDLECGELLARFPGSDSAGFSADGSLWLCGHEGGRYWIHRWPQTRDARTGRCRFGPPEAIRGTHGFFGKDARAQWFAYPIDRHFGNGGAAVFNRGTGREWRLGPQQDARNCAVSPNGRWVAVGSHLVQEGPGAKIWDLKTLPPRHVKDLPAGGLNAVHFSPDGQWLLTTGGGPRLWKVGTWEEGPVLPAPPRTSYHATFSADSKLVALGEESGVVRLVRVENGEEVARLTAPVKSALLPQAFTKNAATLVTIGSETGAVHIFDLRAIRTQLAELGLDWDPASIPPPSPPEAAPLPIEVDTADLGMTAAHKRSHWQHRAAVATVRLALNPLDAQAALQRGQAYARLGENAQAIDDYVRALALHPPRTRDFIAGVPAWQVAGDLNNWAWDWAAKSRSTSTPEARIVRFIADQAVDLAPNEWMFRNTLGVVCYRLGNYADAVHHLERSLNGNNGETAAFDLFFLAMGHHRLGDAAKACECYDRAVRWVQDGQADLPKTWIEELQGFRAEAATVLGRAKP